MSSFGLSLTASTRGIWYQTQNLSVASLLNLSVLPNLSMAFLRNLLLICAATWSHAATVPLEASVQVRNAPGQTVEDTYRAIRRGLAVASLEKCEECKVELPLEKSWSGATLLSV